MVSDLCILTNGKRVVGSPGHTVLVFCSLYYTPIFFYLPGHTVSLLYSLTQSHSVTHTLLVVVITVSVIIVVCCCRVFAGVGIFLYRACMCSLIWCVYPVCTRQKKRCKATYCYLTPIYIPIYTFVVLSSYFPRLAVLQYQYKEQRYHTHPIDK